MRPDHYATLGVSPDATAAEIRAAYLRQLREYHPDRNRSPEAAERTQAIITAFKLLNDFDQRNFYDWDRRRDREATEAATAARPARRIGRAAVAAGVIGLAAIGVAMLDPGGGPNPVGARPTATKAGPATGAEHDPPPVRTATARPQAAPKQRPVTVIRMKAVVLPPQVRVARDEKIEPRPRVRSAAIKVPTPPKIVRVAAKSAPPKDATPVKAAPKPSPPTRVAATVARPSARPAADIASLDQFVMNYYGQSWRYGDAPKRAVLEKSRASFVARRGACAGDTCRRNAYLDLMRDVSSIVETGKPEPR